jgi:hypothetical protein
MSWRGTADEAIVYSAAAIVVEQTGCSTDEAITKLRDRAAAISRTVPDTAHLVIAGVVRFDA